VGGRADHEHDDRDREDHAGHGDGDQGPAQAEVAGRGVRVAVFPFTPDQTRENGSMLSRASEKLVLVAQVMLASPSSMHPPPSP
jgi:hypothetical protein